MKPLKFKILLIGVFLFVTGFSASAQSLMSLMGSQEGNLNGEVEKNQERKTKDLIFYNHDYCDYYIELKVGKSYSLYPGRNMIAMGKNRKKSDQTSYTLTQRIGTSGAGLRQTRFSDSPLPFAVRWAKNYKNSGYRYYPGKFPKKLDESLPYALPVKNGKETAWRFIRVFIPK